MVSTFIVVVSVPNEANTSVVIMENHLLNLLRLYIYYYFFSKLNGAQFDRTTTNGHRVPNSNDNVIFFFH